MLISVLKKILSMIKETMPMVWKYWAHDSMEPKLLPKIVLRQTAKVPLSSLHSVGLYPCIKHNDAPPGVVKYGRNWCKMAGNATLQQVPTTDTHVTTCLE